LEEFKSPEGSTYLDSAISYNVDLDIMESIVFLTPLEGGSTEAMLLVEAVRSPTVGVDHHHFVNCLRV